MRKSNLLYFNGLFLLLMVTYFCLGARYITEYSPQFYGEADSFMLPTISLLNHGSTIITEDDIRQASVDFPEVFDTIYQRYEEQWMPVTEDGGRSPYYWLVYSMFCIPMKLIFKFVGFPQILSFAYTNLFLMLLTAYFVYRKLEIGQLQRILAVCLILFSPVSRYLPWQSAEVFIYCALIMSCFYFVEKKYKRAAFILSLAGTLNVTVMFFGIIIIIDYFVNLYKINRAEQQNFFRLVLAHFVEIVKFGASFLIVFGPYVHNWVYLRNINPIFAYAKLEGVGGRFVSYLFDLSFGIFGYMPLFLLVLLAVVVYCIVKKEYRAMFLLVAALGVTIAYSLTLHINCGMTGVSRYGAWTCAFYFVFFVLYFPWTKLGKISGLIYSFVLVTNVFFLSNSFWLPYDYTYFSKQAEYVLDVLPGLYNPLYSTFNSRVNHVDGGYGYANEIPIIYRNKFGKVRKILLTSADCDTLIDSLSGDDEGMEYCREQLERLQTRRSYFYLNIPMSYNIYSSYEYDKKMQELEEGDILVETKELIDVDGEGVFSMPVNVEENCKYKIELVLSKECPIDDIMQIHVDFYSSEGYDSPEQEELLQITSIGDETYNAYCIIQTQNVNYDNIECRILNYSASGIVVKSMRIVKLQTANE